MKRLFSPFIILSLFVLFSVPAFAAPALPSFMSGNAITVPYEAAESKAKSNYRSGKTELLCRCGWALCCSWPRAS